MVPLRCCLLALVGVVAVQGECAASQAPDESCGSSDDASLLQARTFFSLQEKERAFVVEMLKKDRQHRWHAVLQRHVELMEGGKDKPKGEPEAAPAFAVGREVKMEGGGKDQKGRCAGRRLIANEEECHEAALAMGALWLGSGTDADSPYGCVSVAGIAASWNTVEQTAPSQFPFLEICGVEAASSPASEGGSSKASDGKSFVVGNGIPLEGAGTDQKGRCAGHHVITDEAECHEAALALKSPWLGSGADTDAPYGCLSVSGMATSWNTVGQTRSLGFPFLEVCAEEPK